MVSKNKGLTEKKILEMLVSFQEEVSDGDFSKKGINFWPFVRMRSFVLLSRLHVGANKSDFSKRNKRYLLSPRFWFSLVRIPLQKNRHIFLSHASNYRIPFGNSSFDIYLGPIEEALSETSLVLEYNGGVARKTKKSNIPVDGIYALSFILARLLYIFKYRKKSFLPIDSIKKLSQFFEFYNIEFGEVAARIDADAFHMFVQSRAMQCLFKYLKPKSVILTDWYSLTNMSAILAGNAVGLVTIDVQHGVQSSGHAAYSKWKGDSELFPKYFWVWNVEDKKNLLSNFPISDNCIFVGGIPIVGFFDRLKSKMSKVVLQNLADIQGRKKQVRRPLVLVSLQTSYELESSLISFVNHFSDKFFFLLRGHPASDFIIDQFVDSLSDRAKSHIQYEHEIATSLPLILLFDLVDLHVTFNSSVVIEASSLNKCSIVLDTELGEELFQKDIIDGMAICSSSISEHEAFIESVLSSESLASINSEKFLKIFYRAIGCLETSIEEAMNKRA